MFLAGSPSLQVCKAHLSLCQEALHNLPAFNPGAPLHRCLAAVSGCNTLKWQGSGDSGQQLLFQGHHSLVPQRLQNQVAVDIPSQSIVGAQIALSNSILHVYVVAV